MTQNARAEAPMLHVRYDGRSWDIQLTELDVGSFSNDDQVRQSLAGYLQVPAAKLAHYVVERHANGHMTVRPEAVFG